MTEPHLEQEASTSRFAQVIDLLKVRFWSIVFVLAIAGAIVSYWELNVSVPRFWKVFLLAAGALTPAGYVLGGKLSSLMIDPNWVYLVDLDARRLDGAIYRFPFDEFRELTITNEDGNEAAGYELTQLSPNLFVGKSVDLEELEVVGTWRGTLNDVELARALQAVSECRGDLQDQAQRGFALETSAFTIVHNAVRETTRSIIDTFENGTLPDEGDALENSIDDHLEQFGLDAAVKDVEDIDLEPEDVENDVPTDGADAAPESVETEVSSSGD
ncbi:hypothetical protein [Haloparvum sp. AD34]